MRALLLILLSFSFVSQAQVKWTPVEKLYDKLQEESRPVFAFIHAPWCSYCKLQQKKVFSDPKIATRLNEEYYCISINAETTETLYYAGTAYPSDLQSNGKYLNSLAKLIGEKDGKMNYPTNVFLSEGLVVQEQYPTYLRKSDFKYLLNKE